MFRIPIYDVDSLLPGHTVKGLEGQSIVDFGYINPSLYDSVVILLELSAMILATVSMSFRTAIIGTLRKSILGQRVKMVRRSLVVVVLLISHGTKVLKWGEGNT